MQRSIFRGKYQTIGGGIRTKYGRRYKRPATASTVARAIATRYPGLVRTGGSYRRYGGQARAAGMQPELKFWDADCAGNLTGPITLPTTSQSLNLIPQGDTESTRDGRLAFVKSIHVRGDIILNPSSSTTISGPFYMWLILDTQANGAVAAASDVFTNSGNPSQSFLNLNNSGRFRILKSWVKVMEPQAGVNAAYNHMTYHIDHYMKCNIKIDWSSTTGAITEVRSNNLFLMLGSENIGGDITYDVAVRLRFQG
jgi:hypothetical protein